MSLGKVEGIYICPKRGEPTVLVDQAHVVPGHGIEGDRYFTRHRTTNPASNSGKR